MPSNPKSSLRNASRFRLLSILKTLSIGVTADQSHASRFDCRHEVSSQWTKSEPCTASSASS